VSVNESFLSIFPSTDFDREPASHESTVSPFLCYPTTERADFYFFARGF
jgi:hypothetical protein